MRRGGLGLSIAAVAAGLFGLTLGTSRAIADDDVDDKQEAQIRAKLQKAPELKDDRIEVDVDDGIAVLEGKVDSAREKRTATDLAHVDGVLGVNNRLEVAGSGAGNR